MKRKLQYYIDFDGKWIFKEYKSNVIINKFNYFAIGLTYAIGYTIKRGYELYVHRKDGRIWFKV